MKQKKQVAALLIFAFCIPVLLFICVMILCRITPFGDKTLLIWDADGQYSAFLAAARRIVTGQADPLYSLEKGAGSSLAGLIAYYMASPLNVLTILFAPGDVVSAFHGIVLVKIGLSGLTFMILLHRRNGAGWPGLLFSTAYALAGYTASYFWNIMWMDAVIALPLIALGIHGIVARRGGRLLYAMALGYALFSNYYTGFMLCLFAVLWFVYLYLDALLRGQRPQLVRTAGTFAASSLLAGGLAAVMLIPAFLSLRKGYQLFSLEEPLTGRLFPLIELMTKLFTGAASFELLRSDLPYIYIGLPMLALFGSYALNPAFSARRRVLAAGLVGVFLISFQMSGPYLLWHGLDLPQAMPARFSFLFSFVLIDLAYESFRTFSGPKKGLARRMGAMALAFFAVACLMFDGELPVYLAYETVLLDTLFFLAACGLIVLLATKRRRVALICLCLMQAACLVLNGYFSIDRLEEVNQLGAQEEAAYVQKNAALVARIQEQDGGLYRMERNQARTENDPLYFGYHGVSHYSSDFDAEFLRFLGRMGLYHIHYRIQYASGTTPVLEGLMGIKYILRSDGASLEKLPDSYTQLWREGDTAAWQNPYALPLAVLAPLDEVDGVGVGEDPFENQNLLVEDLSGSKVQVFTPVEDVECYTEKNMMHVSFIQRANQRYYLKASGSWFSLNGAPMESGERFIGCVALPVVAQDTQTTLTAYLGEGEGLEGTCYLATFDEDAFRSAWEKVLTRGCQTQSGRDSAIEVVVPQNSAASQLMLTIPYDRGWQVKVDGVPAETTSRYGQFLAVDLEPGAHTVELRFVPQGLIAGAAISGLSLMALVGWQIGAFRRRRRKCASGLGCGKER